MSPSVESQDPLGTGPWGHSVRCVQPSPHVRADVPVSSLQQPHGHSRVSQTLVAVITHLRDRLRERLPARGGSSEWPSAWSGFPLGWGVGCDAARSSCPSHKANNDQLASDSTTAGTVPCLPLTAPVLAPGLPWSPVWTEQMPPTPESTLGPAFSGLDLHLLVDPNWGPAVQTVDMRARSWALRACVLLFTDQQPCFRF